MPVEVPEEVPLEGVDLKSRVQIVGRESLPQIFELRTPHWGKMDLERSGLAGTKICTECNKIVTEYQDPLRLVVDESSIDWSKTDFFRFRPFGMVYLFVTRRVIEVAREQRWKGVSFVPLGVPFDVNQRFRYAIDPLAKEWPPKEHWD